MKIYNSLTNKIEKFQPLKPKQVSMYVCGPTVYSDPHIGNARPLIVFDLVYRFLLALGYQVTYLSNYTDIDDKIIDKAIALNKSATFVSEKYIKVYEDLAKSLNVKAFQTIKVTETIDEIKSFIEDLIDRGFAYEIDGDVYFRVNKIQDYGQLSNQKIDDLMVGARIDENLKKESPLDFTLWKKTLVGENYSSLWSDGRPGWHTECVVMIKAFFKQDLIDIHGGGMDLKFPHHENEIAQACACCDSGLANYWMHNGLITLDDKKMSKSEGQLILAQDMVDDLGANLVRWLILSTHYRAPLRLSDDLISQSERELKRIFTALNQAYLKLVLSDYTWHDKKDRESLDQFFEALKDDFNTQNAYMVIFDQIKNLNALTRAKALDFNAINKLVNSLIYMLDILGIKYDLIEISADDKDLYAKWNQAKAEKDFKAADKYRQLLSEQGLL